MNRPLILLLAVAVWSAGMFGAGWAWRGDRAEGVEARQETAVVKQDLTAEQGARATEHKQAADMAAIGAKHEEERQAATAIPAAVAAGVRDGSLQLRDDLATCSTSLLSQAVAGTVERDAHAQLRGEVAGAVVQVGRDADDHVRSCQAVIAAGQHGLITPLAEEASNPNP